MMGQDTYENRDMRCAADVGRMAELGRFDVQFDVYGSAVQEQDGRIYYRATGDEEKLYGYMQQKRLTEALYFTPITPLSKRSKVPAGMKEQLLQETKYALMKRMKQDYEVSGYFALMRPFFQIEANDGALAVLEAYQEQIDGHFDDGELQLFLGAAWMAYEAKVLTAAGYQRLRRWHDATRRQMADDPIVADNLERTFYGFVYQKADGGRACVLDAQRMTVVHQREAKLLQGCLAGPVMEKTYWFQQFDQLNAIRQSYREWLWNGQDGAYFQLLQAIKDSPGVIQRAQLQQVREKLANSAMASRAVAYYHALWNDAASR